LRKGYALLLLRRPGEARNGEALSGVSEKAWVAAVEGRRQEAIELARQSELEGANPFVLSATWLELGDFDRAMQGLQEMYEKRSRAVRRTAPADEYELI
jgi:hypothetical protein